MFMAMRKRGELAGPAGTAVKVLLALVTAQLLVAAGMVEMRLPVVMRSVHQAFGVAIWLSVFSLAYLARISAGLSAVAAAPTGSGRGVPPQLQDTMGASAPRHGGRPVPNEG
jgi:heme A synthase